MKIKDIKNICVLAEIMDVIKNKTKYIQIPFYIKDDIKESLNDTKIINQYRKNVISAIKEKIDKEELLLIRRMIRDLCFNNYKLVSSDKSGKRKKILTKAFEIEKIINRIIKYFIEENTEVEINIIDNKYNLNKFYCKIKDINNKYLKKLIKKL